MRAILGRFWNGGIGTRSGMRPRFKNSIAPEFGPQKQADPVREKKRESTEREGGKGVG